MNYLLECNGFFIGEYEIPKFALKSRCVYQMNLPFEYESTEDKDFLSVILNKQKGLAIQLYDYAPIYSGYTCRENKGFLSLIKNRKAVKKLNNFFKVDENTIEKLLISNGIDKGIHWDEMNLFDRIFISLNLALDCSSIVFFDTAGLAPNSVNKILDYTLRTRIEDKTVVHLDYPKHTFNGPKVKEFLTILKTV